MGGSYPSAFEGVDPAFDEGQIQQQAGDSKQQEAL